MRFIYTILMLTALLFAGCNGEGGKHSKADVVVSIEPIKYLVERVVGDDLSLRVLVPAGTGPETYEPTPRDIVSVIDAKMVFSTGLIEFENILLNKVGAGANIVNLSSGVELIEGTCSHLHSDCGHSHGVDPHIWTSPRELRLMAHNLHLAIKQCYPDSVKYDQAYQRLDSELASLEEECRAIYASSPQRSFVIYHPALTYYARCYGLEQMAIESNGKEPSAKHIAQVIDFARENNVRTLLYQCEYPRSVVEVIADDMGVEAVEINPLSDDPVEFIRSVTRTITQQ